MDRLIPLSIICLFLVVPLFSLPNDLYSIMHNENSNSIGLSDVSFNLNEDTKCPKDEDIEPCICKQSCPDCSVTIECSNIANIDVLEKVFEKSGDFPFKTAHFYNLTIMYFPSKSFETKQYRGLLIANSTQVSLFDEPPSSNSLLHSLYLKNIEVQRSIEWELFSGFKNLKDIEITDTNLGKIGDDVGEILPKQMTAIYLTNTNTKSLGDNVFAPLKNLGTIRVSDNEITTIKRSMFPRPYLGSSLNLYNNKIESLPDDFLSDMPALTGLGLQNNSLTSIPESVFGNLPSTLRAIFFEDNPINCDCSMKWITERQMIYLGGQCVKPDAIKGRYLSELKSSDFSYC